MYLYIDDEEELSDKDIEEIAKEMGMVYESELTIEDLLDLLEDRTLKEKHIILLKNIILNYSKSKIFMERKIGERFEHGGVTLEVVKEDTCDGCYFRLTADCSNQICFHLSRNDANSVIFKEVQQ